MLIWVYYEVINELLVAPLSFIFILVQLLITGGHFYYPPPPPPVRCSLMHVDDFIHSHLLSVSNDDNFIRTLLRMYRKWTIWIKVRIVFSSMNWVTLGKKLWRWREVWLWENYARSGTHNKSETVVGKTYCVKIRWPLFDGSSELNRWGQYSARGL